MNSAAKSLIALAGVLSLPSAIAWAQITGEILPASFDSITGGTTTVGIDLVVPAGTSVGGYGAMLVWDPAILEYVADSGGGPPPFDTALVNRTETSAGVLRFADASPAGITGRATILNVTLRAVAPPPAMAAIDLVFTSLFAAGTYANLQGTLTTRGASTCIGDYILDLRASGGASTILTWNAVPGAAHYDVIRGALGAPAVVGGTVDLGAVTCRENNSLDTTTGAGTEPLNADATIPPPGTGFFYLVRAAGPGIDRTYGFVGCALERVAAAGDCP